MRKIFSLGPLIGLFIISLIPQSQAIIPLEGLVLDNFPRENYTNEANLFSQFWAEESTSVNVIAANKAILEKEKLALYRGFFQEGSNLENFCQLKYDIEYASSWGKEQAIRSTLATLQYVALDVSTSALAAYAKYFDYSEDEFKNLTDRLVINYCSPNLTVVSLKLLRKNLLDKFSQEKQFELPTIKDNPFFPQSLSSPQQEDRGREGEFRQTIKLFRSVCSWGQNVDDLRLLGPLINNPMIMAQIFRHLSGKKIRWQQEDNSIHLINDPNSVKVACEHLVCRRRNNTTFRDLFPKGVGSAVVADDLKKMYCLIFHTAKSANDHSIPQIAQWLKEQSGDGGYLIVAQFIALLTGVPDFLVRAPALTQLKKFALESLDRVWKEWAEKQVQDFNVNLFYEEPLTVEKVDRQLYFSKDKPEFKVVLDVNLGEFDTSVQMIGKISAGFKVSFPVDFLQWGRYQWAHMDPTQEGGREKLLETFKKHLTDQITSASQYFIIPPWKGDLEKIVARELLEQLAQFEGPPLDKIFTDAKFMKVQVQFNYAPYALLYIRHKFLIRNIAEGVAKP
ncbi:MAG: hypothetical protein WCG27_04825 [Pseudomonadota bacterium]